MSSVSVIIPALNEEACIGDSVASARAAGADEVIVVDGGSRDRTTTVAAEQATIVTSALPGRARQQNLGAGIASSEILLFLHADCRLSSESVAEVRRRLTGATDVVGGCFRQIIDAPGLSYRAVEIGNSWRARILRCPYGDQGIFVRADVFRALGGFPEMQLMEDLFFCRKLRRAGRMLLLQSALTVSARRWQRRGVVAQTLRNWALVSAAFLGASPDRLARFYPNDR